MPGQYPPNVPPKKGTNASGQGPNSGNIPSFISSAIDKGKDIAQDVFSGAGDLADNFVSGMRGKNLPKGLDEKTVPGGTATWGYGDIEGKDWRVSLSLPGNTTFENSKLLDPLTHTGMRMVFPYTPTIILSHTANYNQIQPIHNNYPFFAYQNSQVDQLVITGQFYNQNSIEARYWIACLHYLRSVTKMEYGLGSMNPGAPPPIVRLNGYGQYVFADTPVIITNFTVDMPNEVDYVATGIVGDQGEPKIDYGDFAPAKATQTGNQMDITWAPAESQFTVTCQPIYSRDKVEKFNYQSFVNGEGIKGGYV
jgi:hypothetical protein|tara:strand:- start:14825 stop:15751 length:927 start_codon:yes stop_codon:yes gene_type:complete